MKFTSTKLFLIFIFLFNGFCSHSQPTYIYYDFNSFNGPGEWVTNGSNIGSVNGNMSFNLNGTLQNNSTKSFLSPNYDFSTNTNNISINYNLNINIRDNVLRFFTDGCLICVRNDELTVSYLDVGGWQVLNSHTGNINGIFSVTVPNTVMRLRIALSTDPGTTAGYGAEVIELTLDQAINLPIVLKSFEVKQLSESVQLQWATSSEINNSHFLIERANDEGIFQIIGRVEGSGTSASENQYIYTDFEPYMGNNYYRLTQVDFNGKSKSYHPKQLSFSSNSEYIIYPNPTKDNVNILLQECNFASLTIQNSHGLKIEEATLKTGKNNIDITHLQNGYYFFKLIIDQQVYVQKIAKFY